MEPHGKIPWYLLNDALWATSRSQDDSTGFIHGQGRGFLHIGINLSREQNSVGGKKENEISKIDHPIVFFNF